ncbi:sensor histidine kinase [Cohnella candidum]|uniref:histidine kinase n=1 Tax=Cohnella candidum TaxID=2674991 RepID=A0A3G3K446_9BACL|nr:HAMP domain-containing sensor histidine kinase [Cohnella candidum]AYQ74529.1 sensor histidine kinase [Cohnella candidum]
MTFRTKLILWIGGLASCAYLIALRIGRLWGGSSENGYTGALFWMTALFGLAFIWTMAWWAGQRLAARIRSLLGQAAAGFQPGGFQAIRIGGKDEVAELAALMNRLVVERIAGDEARSRLVSDSAHELRTPVAILRGHLETMLKGAAELKRENLVSLLDETKRMSRLISELQQVSLAEAGKLKLDRSWTPISHMIQEVADIFAVEAEDKRIKLTCRLEEDDEVYCDASRMKQVMINLIGNAIRYTPEQGSVDVIQTIQLNGQIRVEVSDTGPGIAPEKLPYIFHRFYRVDDARNRSDGGTGLGLAIAKQFVEAHGGTLEVSSTQGEGTRFILQLPIFPDH